jgi:NAD(P)H-dependent FMN reductase
MIKLQVIIGSTRPNRAGKGVGDWVYEVAKKRHDIEVELVDVAALELPLLDEPVPPSVGQPTKEHTKQWAAKVAEADGYIFVTAEYNHSVPGALKNAIDYVYKEWNNKAAGFVSYGSNGGSRAVEHLRGILGEVQIADVREQLLLSLANDFENYSTLKPTPAHEQQLGKVIDQVVSWATALQGVREGAAAAR